MQYKNLDNYLETGNWDIKSINPSELWDFAEDKFMDNEFFVILTLCTQTFAETFMTLYNKYEYDGTVKTEALKLYEVEKGIERLYSDGILREEDLRRIVKAFAKMATMVQAGLGMDTPLLSRFGHKWFLQ